MDDEDGGLFNIALSDSESEEKAAASAAKASRTGQTEEDFQAIKQTYHAKIENGNVYKNVKLPLEKGARKHLIQEVMYAAEELYYFRRFEEAVVFLSRVLAEGEGGSEAFDDETRALLVTYRETCEKKLNQQV